MCRWQSVKSLNFFLKLSYWFSPFSVSIVHKTVLSTVYWHTARRTLTFSPSAVNSSPAFFGFVQALRRLRFCEKLVFGCEKLQLSVDWRPKQRLCVSLSDSIVDSKKIKRYITSPELSTVIFTVAPVWFTAKGKKGIDVSDQWKLTTKSQRASVYIIVMNRDVVNIVKCHKMTLWFTGFLTFLDMFYYNRGHTFPNRKPSHMTVAVLQPFNDLFVSKSLIQHHKWNRFNDKL